MKTQADNWHTIEQIKAMGNQIIGPKKGEYGLITQRGKTITYWIQEEDKFYPVDAKTID